MPSPQTADHCWPCTVPADAALACPAPAPVALWSYSGPALWPVFDTTSEYCRPMVSPERVKGCELARPLSPCAAGSLCVAPATRPCRIARTVSSTSTLWEHLPQVFFLRLDSLAPRPRRESSALETHHPQAALSIGPIALTLLSAPN